MYYRLIVDIFLIINNADNLLLIITSKKFHKCTFFKLNFRFRFYLNISYKIEIINLKLEFYFINLSIILKRNFTSESRSHCIDKSLETLRLCSCNTFRWDISQWNIMCNIFRNFLYVVCTLHHITYFWFNQNIKHLEITLICASMRHRQSIKSISSAVYICASK